MMFASHFSDEHAGQALPRRAKILFSNPPGPVL